MSVQITVELPDDVYRQAQALASQTGQNIEDIVADAVRNLSAIAVNTLSPQGLSDEAVMALAESRMDAAQNARMSTLLDKRQNAELDDTEQQELSRLLHIYQEGSLRKAEALVEATGRGLKPALS